MMESVSVATLNGQVRRGHRSCGHSSLAHSASRLRDGRVSPCATLKASYEGWSGKESDTGFQINGDWPAQFIGVEDGYVNSGSVSDQDAFGDAVNNDVDGAITRTGRDFASLG